MHRHLAALVLLVGLFAAACGDDGDSGATTDESTTTSSSTTTTSEASPTTSEPTTTTTTSEAPEPVLTILVTNDDGVMAPGIDALVEALVAETDHLVTVVAPDGNRSGSSDTTTDGEVTWIETTTASGVDAIGVSGFPADAVIVALDELGVTPDLVISGINEGQNIGPLVELSGTVGAARTAARRGLPALAVSQGFGEPPDFPTAADLALAWLDDNDEAIAGGELGASVANLNVPTCPVGEVRGTLEAAVATDAADRQINEVDCASTETGPVDDIDAFLAGFAPLSSLEFAAG